MFGLKRVVATFKSYKLYNIINILGLALSLSCTITLTRYIYREFTVDSFNKNIDRVCAVITQRDGYDSYMMSYFDNPNKESGYTAPSEHPDVEALTEYIVLPNDYITYDNIRYSASIYAVDSLFMPITGFTLSKGDVRDLFCSPGDAVVSPEFAKKMFGDTDPIGKTIIYSTGKPITIKGVLYKSATKSFMNYDILISRDLEESWGRTSSALLLLHKGSSIDKLNEDYSQYKAYRYTNNNKIRVQFVDYKSLYFDEMLSWSYYLQYYNKGNYSSILMLIAVAVAVFLIGIFNFVNIYTVMLLKRGKEFGLKKVFGVGAFEIFKQLFVENMLLVICSVAVGWMIVVAAKDFLISLNMSQVSHWQFDVALTLVLILVVSAITSLYPYLKYKREVSVVSIQKMSNLKSTSAIRSILLMLQYVVSITMIIFSVYFVKQLNFMLNKDLGFNTEDVVEASFFPEDYTHNRENREKIISSSQVVQQQLNTSPIVNSYYFGSKIDDSSGEFKVKSLGGDYKEVNLYYMASSMANVYDLQATKGRMPVDSIDYNDNRSTYTMWINESAARVFNIKDLDTIQLQVSQRLWWSYDTAENYNPPYKVLGVVKDFKISHLRYSTSPSIYIYESNRPDETLVVRFEKGELKEGIELLKNLYNEHVGNGDLKYELLSNRMAEKYENDKLMATIFTTFAVIALIISSLGLFSLSLYDIERRYREIALRRVCGAQASQIVKMFLEKYMRQLLVAFVVASVISYLMVDLYMKDFAERTPLSWWLFVLAALITALVSFTTLVWHTRRAAATNPATIMKTE